MPRLPLLGMTLLLSLLTPFVVAPGSGVCGGLAVWASVLVPVLAVVAADAVCSRCWMIVELTAYLYCGFDEGVGSEEDVELAEEMREVRILFMMALFQDSV